MARAVLRSRVRRRGCSGRGALARRLLARRAGPVHAVVRADLVGVDLARRLLDVVRFRRRHSADAGPAVRGGCEREGCARHPFVGRIRRRYAGVMLVRYVIRMAKRPECLHDADFVGAVGSAAGQDEGAGHQRAPDRTAGVFAAGGALVVIPLPSSMVTNWFAATLATRSFAPLGHSTSIALTVASFASPNVMATSLWEA